ncbi:MAG TPA: hypothetical protein PKA39_08350 [Ignavibacteria bacterium]|jgi:predicted DNA-binding protein|nr:hypothetical protein [Ignavibacteria bacterium]
MTEKKPLTIAKGYRLRPETHQLIKAVQKQTGGSQEKVISEAMKQYKEQITKNKPNLQ